MGYNQHCVVSTCTQNCCNFYGNCINSQSTANQIRFCYYFYGRDITNAQYETITALLVLVWVMVAIAVIVIFAILFSLLLGKTNMQNKLLAQDKIASATLPTQRSKQTDYLPYTLKVVMQRERESMPAPPALKTPVKEAEWNGEFHRSINNLYKQTPDQAKKIRFYATQLHSLATSYQSNHAI